MTEGGRCVVPEALAVRGQQVRRRLDQVDQRPRLGPYSPSVLGWVLHPEQPQQAIPAHNPPRYGGPVPFVRPRARVLGTYRGACRSTTRDGRAKTPTSAARAAAVCSALCSRAAASRAARARATVVARCCVLYATRRMSHVASSAERAGRAEAGERGKCASPVCHLAPQYPEYPGA